MCTDGQRLVSSNIGSPEDELRGRGNVDKTLVVVSAQEDGKGITDGWKGYSSVGSLGYTHEVTCLEGQEGGRFRLIFYTTVSEVIDYQRVAVLETA